MFSEDYQTIHRAEEGRRINRGFLFLQEHGQVEDEWERDPEEVFPESRPSLFFFQQEKPRSTPWKRVVNPRYEAIQSSSLLGAQ